jgi:hypothetical protein
MPKIGDIVYTSFFSNDSGRETVMALEVTAINGNLITCTTQSTGTSARYKADIVMKNDKALRAAKVV